MYERVLHIIGFLFVAMTDTFDVMEQISQAQDIKKKSGAWKVFEREVANFFGTTRSPMSGMIKAVTNSDSLHRKLYIECKYRATFSLITTHKERWDWWEKETRLAAKFRPQEEFVRKAVVYRLLNSKKYPGGAVYFFSPEDIGRVLYGITFKGGRPAINAKRVEMLPYKADSLLALYKETEERAMLEEKIPLVCVKMKQTKGWLIGIAPQYIEHLRSYGQ